MARVIPQSGERMMDKVLLLSDDLVYVRGGKAGIYCAVDKGETVHEHIIRTNISSLTTSNDMKRACD
jgi:hypothetical protein